MIIVGDYASVHQPDFRMIQTAFANEQLVINLEGAIAVGATEVQIRSLQKKIGLFNTEVSFQSALELHLKAAVLANNHVFDLKNDIDETLRYLKKNGISYCGAGQTITEAGKPMIIQDFGQEYALVSFCWEITGGKMAIHGQAGVNPLTDKDIQRCISETKRLHPAAKVIAIMHWAIELEKYPEPMHVKQARWAIDCGADVVIGHHPHRIQAIDEYKGKPIFYSIGNFYIEEGIYFDGCLRYPQCAQESMAVKIHPDGLNVLLLKKLDHGLCFQEELPIDEAARRFALPATKEQYDSWFRKNRVKKKGIPIFYDDCHHAANALKKMSLTVRAILIRCMLTLGLKKGRGSSDG